MASDIKSTYTIDLQNVPEINKTGTDFDPTLKQNDLFFIVCRSAALKQLYNAGMLFE